VEHCNTLENAATHCTTEEELVPFDECEEEEEEGRGLRESSTGNISAVYCSVFQCVAVCCCVLQCVAVCYSVLQCAAVCCSMCYSHVSNTIALSWYSSSCHALRGAVCCSVRQRL